MRTIPRAFGTKVRVCSLIPVIAWKRLTAKPMIMAAPRNGAAR